MTWITYHKESNRFASDAEIATRRGDDEEAQELYAQAADAEKRALESIELGPSRLGLLGTCAVSVVSLYLKADRLETAESVAHRWLKSDWKPDFAIEQIRELLISIEERKTQDGYEDTRTPEETEQGSKTPRRSKGES